MIYYVGYRCSNCLHSFLAQIEKGVEAPLSLHCPNCGWRLGLKKVSSREVGRASIYKINGMNLEKI